MRVDVVTIFPEYLAPLELSLVGKARRAGVLDLRVHDLRDWTADRHRTVDDTPIGGGAGMVMRPDVWGEALDGLVGVGSDVELLVPTPSGEPFTQRTAERLATVPHLVVACGRYEGIDARVAEHYRGRGVAVTEVSLGDYVLNGGEVAALVVVEAVARLLPGVVGNPESLVEESHGAAGVLEYPVYTRPPLWRDQEVPEVLLSGHHARIARWRRDRALERTAARRPDLLRRLAAEELDAGDRAVLEALGWSVGESGPEPPRESEPEPGPRTGSTASGTSG
nr:tRNA (guanosine(37)-N1)-methyltransferase TrmD [uncultured Actinotalea sp.]